MRPGYLIIGLAIKAALHKMRKSLFKAIYDLILITTKPLRLLRNFAGARSCGSSHAILAQDSRIIFVGVEGRLINNEKFRGPKLQIPQFHFKNGCLPAGRRTAPWVFSRNAANSADF